MANFSERYGYTKPSSVLVRERLTDEIINAICTAYDLVNNLMEQYGRVFSYNEMEQHLWCYFLNNRLNDFLANKLRGNAGATEYIKSNEYEWFKKLDLIEETLLFLDQERIKNKGYVDNYYDRFYNCLVNHLNKEFKRLHFAYRIIDNQIVEVTSEEEITAIENALTNSSNGVKEHLQTALKLLSERPNADYRNSIKESISAVEVIVREITGESTLKIEKLKSNGIVLPEVLEKAFRLLYGYTNDETTGIRHALMEGTNKPNDEEAIFMLVSCSAFINYLTKKRN